MLVRHLLIVALAVSMASAWDPLYYENLSSVLPSMDSDGDVAIGFFSAGGYWATDSTGESQSYDFETALSVIRLVASGRYGLTSSHTVGVLVPAFFQVAGDGDSTGAGIADPWLTLDGWLSRTPMLIGRLGLRIPLKGYLESGDYSESDPHLALDGALTVETPLSGPGTVLRGTGGLRYSFGAWSALPAFPRDSAETRPPVELRMTGFVVMKANPELELRIGGEFATRGDVDAEIGGEWQNLENTSRRSLDLRAGFDVSNASLSLSGDIYYRLSGGNVNREWGIVLSGLGLDFTDLFGIGSGGR